VVLDDAVSGTKIGIYYATPTAPQVKAYRQQSIRRKGNKVILDSFDPALKFGLEIITGPTMERGTTASQSPRTPPLPPTGRTGRTCSRRPPPTS
jgi:hypothetical protein